MTLEPKDALQKDKGSYLATFRGVAKLLDLCSKVVADAQRHRLTAEIVDERARALGEYIVRESKIDLTVSGLENLDPHRTYLFMSNHESLMDIPLLFATAPRPPRMVTKAELFKVPLWGPALRVSGFIAIDRKDRKSAIESLRQAKALMDKGLSVWISPEGTRSRDGSLQPFKKGGFMLALETGMPIVPVGIVGARNVIRPKSFKSFLGQKVLMRYGHPIDPATYGMERRDDLMQDVRKAIEELRRP